MGDLRPIVVVYTHSLLGPSMTFIKSHAESLRRYQPVYAGSRRVPGLELPEGRVHTANTGGMQGLAREFMFRRLGMAGGLAAQLLPFKPSLVHAHFGQSGPAALDLAEALGVPMVVTYHGQDATISEYQARKSWRGREYLRGRERVASRSRAIIAVSDFIREQLLEQGYPPEKIVTHRNGIDLDFFHPVTGARDTTAIFVGRFVEKKGAEYFVRALGELQRQGSSIRGVLVGDGPLRPKLERLARKVGANAEFPGFMQLTEVRNQLSRACVTVVPSVTAADGNREGLPTVILEAQAMATPVVATRHAGNAEGLREGETALLVDEHDVVGLTEAIRFFVENPAAARQFGESGRMFVEENFSIGSQVRELERIYDRACGAA